jgi:serine/threonine protein kinase
LLGSVLGSVEPLPALPSAASSSPSHHLRIIDLKLIQDLRHLNEGAAGVAFVGRYDDQDVVVKQPKKLKIGSEEWLELQLHMSVPPHPHIIPFIGICMVQVQMYLVTRFIERGSLKSLLTASAEHGGDALRAYYAHPLQLVRAACQIAAGLEHLHASHIVHRDVAARNILVTADGSHIVSDFGLSRRMEKQPNANDDPSAPHSDDVYTMHSLTALPARWTSPEALRSQQFTAASDVYSLGLTCYEMASGGALPYARVKDNLQVIAGVVMGDLSLDFPPHTSPVVVGFIQRAMQPIETRPTMSQLKQEMETWLRGEIAKQQAVQQAELRGREELGIEMVQL